MPQARVGFSLRPTGALQVGGARTALFSWLFARCNRGSLVLQIDDMDVADGPTINWGRETRQGGGAARAPPPPPPGSRRGAEAGCRSCQCRQKGLEAFSRRMTDLQKRGQNE